MRRMDANLAMFHEINLGPLIGSGQGLKKNSFLQSTWFWIRLGFKDYSRNGLMIWVSKLIIIKL